MRKYRYFNRKIERLWSKRQRIESILYMGILIEYLVKESIFLFEKIVEGASYRAKVGFNPRNLCSKKDIENQPLGYLIMILNTYTKDKILIRDLKKFSKKRNDIIHKLFFQDISKVNKQLKDFNVFFYELMIMLLKLLISLENHVKKEFVYVCDDCFKDINHTCIKL